MSAGELPNDFQAKRKRLKIVFIISLFLTFVLGIIFIFSAFRGFIDFPCFVEVEDGILKSGGYEEYTETSHAVLFITTYYAHMSGGGCLIVDLADGESKNIGNYQVQVNDDILTMSGENQISAGDRFEDGMKRLSINPWFWYEDSFKLTNHGYIHGTQSRDDEIQELEHKLLIATGSKGSREHLNPVTPILFFLTLIGTVILGPFLIIQRIRGK
jgi:hypothetical protein